MKNRKLYVVEQFPTKQLLEDAKKERFMVFTFIVKPDSIIDQQTSRAYQEGWLAGLGLKPSPYLALVIVPKNVDFEIAKEHYLKTLVEMSVPNFKLNPNLKGLSYENVQTDDSNS